jgi:gentisate 1,2-dioxygenase
MRPGDVLLTPAWAWHSHDNVGPDDCYWMDFLDVPLVHLLEPMFYEPHPEGVEADPAPVDSSPLAFRREDTLARLDVAAASDDAHASVQLGDPALKTIRLDMQRLIAGRETARCRTTANIIYAVVEGHGQTDIDGQTFNWSFGDTIAIPAWRPYRHRADSDALLLKVSTRRSWRLSIGCAARWTDPAPTILKIHEIGERYMTKSLKVLIAAVVSGMAAALSLLRRGYDRGS